MTMSRTRGKSKSKGLIKPYTRWNYCQAKADFMLRNHNSLEKFFADNGWSWNHLAGKQHQWWIHVFQHQALQWSFSCLWVMCEPTDKILPVLTVALAEQSAKEENENYFLSECCYRQVLTNTDLYFSKGRGNWELLKYFKNNTASLSTAKPSQKQITLGFSRFHGSLQSGRYNQAVLRHKCW